MGRGMVKPRKSITMRATVPYCTNVVTRSNWVAGFRDPTWCRVTRPFPPKRETRTRAKPATFEPSEEADLAVVPPQGTGGVLPIARLAFREERDDRGRLLGGGNRRCRGLRLG